MQVTFTPIQRPLATSLSSVRRTLSAPTLRFGEDKPVFTPKALAKSPLIAQYVFAGKEPVETPLTQRPWTDKALYAEYKTFLQEQMSDLHPEGPLLVRALMRLEIALHGLKYRLSPRDFKRFKQDERGQLEYALIAHGNEKAFEYGVRRPSALLKQGRFDEALRSFQVALDAAPSRRAETYETLGNMCAMLHRFQADMKAEGDTMAYELNEQLESTALNSSLISSRIVPEKGKDSKLPFSFSSSFVRQHYTHYLQPIDWPALRQNLAASPLPFRRIAQEAYAKAAELTPDTPEQGTPSDQKRRLTTMAHWMAGDLNRAINGLMTLLAPKWDDPLSLHPTDLRPLVEVFKEAGKLDKAIATTGFLLNKTFQGYLHEEHYVELFNLCRRKAKQDPSGNTNPWAIALPHLEAVLKKPVMAYIHSGNWLPRLYLAKAYEALDQPKSALMFYKEALQGVVELRDYHKDYPAYLPKTQRRYDEIQARITALEAQLQQNP